jgi:transposase
MATLQLALVTDIFLPSDCNLYLDNIHLTTTTLDLCVSNPELQMACPSCGTVANRIHSRYKRLLSDLSCCGRRLCIHWTVRRFFCDGPDCRKITFSEQVPLITKRYARKTQRLTDRLQMVGLEAGGEAGKRLSNLFDISISGDQLIRLVKTSVEENRPAPTVLGIDDWAWRKRHRYGTILVDLERKQVVDVLPDRKPETVAQWLKNHPGIEIISRDRGQEFIEGIAQGLPNVIQVADRFHLLRNLLETLQRMLERNPGELKAASKQLSIATVDNSPALAETHPPIENSKSPRQEIFEKVKIFQAQGVACREIARRVGLDHRTVSKYFRLDAPPNPKGWVSQTSKVASYHAYLQKRLMEGCRNLKTLYEELQKIGFNGSYASVFRAVHRLGVGNLKRSVLTPPPPLRFSPRQAAWILFQNESQLPEHQASFRKALCAASSIAAKSQDLVQMFREMVKNRQPEKLDAWLQLAESSSIPEFVRLAVGFRGDYAAVRNGLMSQWSNGQVEGQVNRLKLIKRQMYGRAGFDLLRRRVLGPAPFS